MPSPGELLNRNTDRHSRVQTWFFVYYTSDVLSFYRYTTQDKDGVTGTDVGNPDGTQGNDDSGVSKVPITLEGDDLPSGDDSTEEGSGDEIPAYDVFIEGEMNDGENSEESDEGSTED
ncbi:rh38 [macacine betaherpesvirus 3]|uniref:Rh38 n=1 Tax=Rhesus cytomegalovirus (strain 68-1) TaxID=47929 RepID=Q7TFU3_RHCM6|nr:rh38 [macacine betaherpesvirus 3]AAP50565.1 rh38 [macacine betaherpesvirus 3]AAZ80537.1 rh38 [macacine betaherpesvirus 3]